ncbi:hypothetical protein [Seonamhaeicola maritimus]|uniref:hypothetical protein n=1 Tax=Seonamhaeicola maritimus TaxID=2591822 RepID=UPI002494EE45|nr:hypothetical protein [Seonamhaeicola maritimus]
MLGKIHLFFGILVVIIFLLTGQYMDKSFNHLQDMELMNRALFRAGHLYILLFGLINAALGAHLKLSKTKWINLVQKLGSLVIFCATILVIYGFFTELPTEDIERPLTRFSLYLILFGVSVHGLISLVPNKYKTI